METPTDARAYLAGRGGTDTTTQETTSVRLRDIFDVTNSPIRAVIAAIFGLTPSLLISRLGNGAGQFAKQIATTQATSG